MHLTKVVGDLTAAGSDAIRDTDLGCGRLTVDGNELVGGGDDVVDDCGFFSKGAMEDVVF